MCCFFCYLEHLQNPMCHLKKISISTSKYKNCLSPTCSLQINNLICGAYYYYYGPPYPITTDILWLTEYFQPTMWKAWALPFEEICASWHVCAYLCMFKVFAFGKGNHLCGTFNSYDDHFGITYRIKLFWEWTCSKNIGVISSSFELWENWH